MTDRGHSENGKNRSFQLGSDLEPTVNRLAAIAKMSGDALLLGEGPVLPDANLLDLCEAYIHCAKAQLLAEKKWRCGPTPAEDREGFDALYKAMSEKRRLCRSAAIAASKIPAQTGPGIYAKALIVRSSSGQAPGLAKSLADDLILHPTLRRLLFPAALEDVSQAGGD